MEEPTAEYTLKERRSLLTSLRHDAPLTPKRTLKRLTITGAQYARAARTAHDALYHFHLRF